MKLIVLAFMLLILGTAHAAKVEDVKVLDLKFEKDAFVVKFQLKGARDKEHFSVQIPKEDEKGAEKLALVLKKHKQGEKFRLDLEIPSFSPQSGSHYRSQSVKFSGTAEGESLLGD